MRAATIFGSDLTRSKALAKRIREVGGDGGQHSQYVAAVKAGNTFIDIRDKTTRLLVIRYEADSAN